VDRRTETRVITVPKVGGGFLVQKDASRVWQITVNPRFLFAQGQIDIYDGFDTQGKHEWQLLPGYSRINYFLPPIPCDYGIYVNADAHIISFTIVWEVLKWRRGRA